VIKELILITNTAHSMQGDLLRHLGVKTPYLSLRHHLIVLPLAGTCGSDDLDVMEKEGYFPPTVSWLNYEGLKVKLYESPSVGRLTLGNLEINSGGLGNLWLPDAEDRIEDFRHTGDRSMLATKPVVLPEKTLELIRVLKLLKAC
jgi:hypothetical protein